jgi:hypothetical protein
MALGEAEALTFKTFPSLAAGNEVCVCVCVCVCGGVFSTSARQGA